VDYASLFDTVDHLMATQEDQEQRRKNLHSRLVDHSKRAAASPRVTIPGLEMLARERQQARRQARRRTRERLNQICNGLFVWEPPVADITELLSRHLNSLEESDWQLLHGNGFSLEEPLLFELRSLLTRTDGRDTLFIDELTAQVVFVQRQPVEIHFWTALFLEVERCHREKVIDLQQHEETLEHVKRRLEFGGVLRSYREFIIYTEAALERWPAESDLTDLSTELERELAGRLNTNLFSQTSLSLALRAVLECHQYCKAETIPADQRARLQLLRLKREIFTLEDLMLLLFDFVFTERRIPPASLVLDILQQQGFPIEHRDFRDTYRANLIVPLEDSWKVRRQQFYIATPLQSLSGDMDLDLNQGRTVLIDLLQKQQRFLGGQASAYFQSRQRPLPRSDVLKQAAAFVLFWEAAAFLGDRGFAGLKQLELAELLTRTRSSLPAGLRKLIRPRKGYEFKSRSAFNAYLERCGRSLLTPLQEMQATKQVTSPHHAAILMKVALLAGLPWQGPLTECPEPQVVAAIAAADPWKALQEYAATVGLDLIGAAPTSVAQLEHLLADAIDRQEVLERALQKFPQQRRREISQELAAVFADSCRRLAAVIYRLAVARARGKAQLPRLQAPAAALTDLITFQVPTLPQMESAALEAAKERIRGEGFQGLLPSYRPIVLSRQELTALAKYHLAQLIQETSSSSANGGSDLQARLSKALDSYDIAPIVLESEHLSAFLLNIVHPEDRGDPEEWLQLQTQLYQLLPRTNCGACGFGTCFQFAEALLQARVGAGGCHQLEAGDRHLLEQRLREMQLDALPSSPHELSREEQHLLKDFFITENVVSRIKTLQSHQRHYQQNAAKLALFKRPDPENFYRHLVNYLGREAAERLSPEERAFLEQRGQARVEAAWQSLRRERDWLFLELRWRQSAARQLEYDPAVKSQLFYSKKLFLNQLSSTDRSLVLNRRLELYMEDFAEWWNGDLLQMSDPNYQIQDWDDFSKVIKNAYWHQENTPAAGNILLELLQQVESDRPLAQECRRYLQRYVHGLAGLEYQQNKKNRQQLAAILQNRSIHTHQQLELLLVDYLRSLPRALRYGAKASPTRAVLAAFEKFNLANVQIAPELRFVWLELPEDVRRSLAADPQVEIAELSRFQAAAAGLTWAEMDTLRAAIIRGLLSAAWQRLRQEHQEANLLTDMFTGKGAASRSDSADSGQHRLPLMPGMLRCWLRQRFSRTAQNLAEVRKELDRRLQGHPQLYKDLLEEALNDLIRQRLSVAVQFQESGSSREHDFELLTRWIDKEIRRKMSMDRERLLRSLFVLAKMEGNLDSLTALLRGIRETSDIIEAAWLRFTENRAGLAPLPELPQGKIGLRLAFLKDKSSLGEYLRHGVPRGEKKQIVAAMEELIIHIRFHILAAPQERPEPETILTAMRNRGYTLDGIDSEALLARIRLELANRSHYQDDKIRIFTTAIAHNLAAESPVLAEAERQLYRERANMLAVGQDRQNRKLADICSLRGVELAKVKEKMYYQLSELLEQERVTSFQKRITQIVAQLDKKRREIGNGWRYGKIDRRTIFYLLRTFQKEAAACSWSDYLTLLRDHYLEPMKDLALSGHPDTADLQQQLVLRVSNALAVDLVKLEENARKEAKEELERALADRLHQVTELFHQYENPKKGEHMGESS